MITRRGLMLKCVLTSAIEASTFAVSVLGSQQSSSRPSTVIAIQLCDPPGETL